MQLTVTSEERFHATPQGAVSFSGVGGYSFWAHFLDVFDEVVVLGRAASVPASGGGETVVGPGVRFAALPDYRGPAEYLKVRPVLRRMVERHCRAPRAFMLRVPGGIAGEVLNALSGRRRPCYGAQVLGDPYDVFRPGAVPYRLSALFRWHFCRQVRRICQRAVAVTYVTKHVLQARYPAGATAYVTDYSNVQLTDDQFVSAPRRFRRSTETELVTVASLEQPYKGVDVVLRAVRRCRDAGATVRLTIVGDGVLRPRLEEEAAALGIAESVRFTGQISRPRLFGLLDEADVFVLASRTEGLPRALVEAMARGLPCIGSRIGGIPELLAPCDLIDPEDHVGLGAAIIAATNDPGRLEEMSARNLIKAREYRRPELQARERAFLTELRRRTEQSVIAA